jgi:xanthine dehydrogenase iron-sulfur cluster and FAD-binding subunit A
LIGKKLTPETLDAAAAMIRQEVSPIDDVRADAAYRRTVCGNLLLRLAGETGA